MDNIADIVCRALSASLPNGEEYRLIGGTLATISLGLLRKEGCTDEVAKGMLIEFIRSAPITDLTEIQIQNNG